MKQDADWQVVSDSYDPLTLLKLIEKIILKQSDNQYKIGIIMEQLKLLLAYRQDDGVTNAAYYDRFKTRVDVAVFYNEAVLIPKLKNMAKSMADFSTFLQNHTNILQSLY